MTRCSCLPLRVNGFDRATASARLLLGCSWSSSVYLVKPLFTVLQYRIRDKIYGMHPYHRGGCSRVSCGPRSGEPTIPGRCKAIAGDAVVLAVMICRLFSVSNNSCPQVPLTTLRSTFLDFFLPECGATTLLMVATRRRLLRMASCNIPGSHCLDLARICRERRGGGTCASVVSHHVHESASVSE
jgi:hypothetical protein